MARSVSPKTVDIRCRVRLAGRETEVLALIATGNRAKVIAERLALSKWIIELTGTRHLQ